LSERPARIGRASGIAIQIVAGAVVTGVLLLVAEGTARLVVGPPPAASRSIVGGGADYVSDTLAGLDVAPEVNPTPLVTDPFVLWWNKPGARKTQPVNPRPFGRNDTWTIENDARGFRGPERPAAGTDEEVYRILCVGDSVTFGFNVDQPSAYPRQLEDLLRARHPGARIDVLNAGVPGWSWVQGLRFLEAYGMRVRPDLVIAAHGTNDQFWPATRTDRERLPGGGQPAPEMSPASFVQRTSLYRLFQRIGRPAAAAAPSAACREEIAQRGGCRRVPLADIETTVREMHALVRAHEADLVALNLDFIETPAAGAARRAAEAAGIPFVDFVERFRVEQRNAENARAVALRLQPPGPIGTAMPGRPKRVVFRVLRAFADDAPMSVRGGAYFRHDFPFAAPLHDDGSGGDEVAGDGVFSGSVDAPADVGVLEYAFWLGDTCEFTPLPPLPSTGGTRLLRFDRDTIGPVVEFADGFLMAERTHPNARGQTMIATALAELIETLSSFHAWRARSADRS
jgi:lysophospholipase L1-like esterase